MRIYWQFEVIKCVELVVYFMELEKTIKTKFPIRIRNEIIG